MSYWVRCASLLKIKIIYVYIYILYLAGENNWSHFWTFSKKIGQEMPPLQNPLENINCLANHMWFSRFLIVPWPFELKICLVSKAYFLIFDVGIKLSKHFPLKFKLKLKHFARRIFTLTFCLNFPQERIMVTFKIGVHWESIRISSKKVTQSIRVVNIS